MAQPRTRSTRRTSSKAITYVVVKDFKQGISARSDKVQMPIGASPMARNVEWQDSGGFYVRKGVGALPYGNAGAEMQPPGKVPVRFYHYIRDPTATTAFTSQYIVSVEDGGILVGEDFGSGVVPASQWMTMNVAGSPLVTLGNPAITAFDTNLYLSVGTQATNGSGLHMIRWNGALGAALGTAWANDLAAPTGGNMPPARYISYWSERMWAACCLPADGSPIQASRIRWSHPGRPEDWAENDYIDVGQQGDVITGIAPMRDMLVIFKRSSTYALLGSGSTNFRVVELSGTIGCTGEWTRDNQGTVVFWDATIGLCRFDGKGITNLFEPLLGFLQAGAGGSITRCGGVVTDGERIYVTTDFQDYYGPRVADPITRAMPKSSPLVPGQTTWAQLTADNITWAGTAGIRWLRVTVEFYNIVWVYRQGAGWTSFTLQHPNAQGITMLGQLRSRLNAAGDIDSNRRIVYGLSSGTVPLYLSDRYDNGRDWWTKDDQRGIDAFYMTPWLHGGLPAQIKRWKAPRVIQEADQAGILLIDVFYDFNYDFLRRTLRTGVVTPLSFDSYAVGKPGTIGRAKAVMLVVRPEAPRHWGVSSLTIPVHPKVLR
jgi:hypothetical protein